MSSSPIRPNPPQALASVAPYMAPTWRPGQVIAMHRISGSGRKRRTKGVWPLVALALSLLGFGVFVGDSTLEAVGGLGLALVFLAVAVRVRVRGRAVGPRLPKRTVRLEWGRDTIEMSEAGRPPIVVRMEDVRRLSLFRTEVGWLHRWHLGLHTDADVIDMIETRPLAADAFETSKQAIRVVGLALAEALGVNLEDA